MSQKKALLGLMSQGIDRGVFPGGVLLVQVSGQTEHLSAHGRTSLDAAGEAVLPETCFDLASLTKILATSNLALDALQRGTLRLEDSLVNLLPQYQGPGKQPTTLLHLLEHSSGLPECRPYYRAFGDEVERDWIGTCQGRDWIRQRVAEEPLVSPPGATVRYSDLNFILLDWILERASGRTLDETFRERVSTPLGIEDLFFVDQKDPSRVENVRRQRRFAATERCLWRGRTLVGEVHDENTFAMGGISGHAGLFGTADSIARVCASWLDSFHGRGNLWEEGCIRRFWTRSAVPGSTRALGFDMPSPAPEYSAVGRRFGPGSVGHNGFTGTSIWLDPQRDLFVVLLTNRVHPSRENLAIRQFRPRLHDLVVEDLFGGKVGVP